MARHLRSLVVLLSIGWLAWISGWYVEAVMQHAPGAARAGGHLPINIFSAAVGLAAVLGAWAGSKGRRALAAGTVWLTLALGLGILLAGPNAGAVIAVAWIGWTAWAAGLWVVERILGRETAPRCGRGILAIAIGLGLASHVVLALGLIGVLQRWVVILILAGVSVLGWRRARATAHALLRLPGTVSAAFRFAHAWYVPPLLTLLAGWSLFIFIQALAPETGYDPLMYHLALPRLYIEHGRYFETPYLMQSWFYLGADMNFVLAMLIGGEIAAKLTHLLFLLITVAALAVFGGRMFGRRAGIAAAVLYATMPLVAWEATSALVDLAVACYAFLTIATVYLWTRCRKRGWLWVAGLTGGLAVSVKVSALYALLPVSLFIIASGVSSDRIRGLLAFAGGGILSGFPWPLLRFVQTGNPVFPFYNEVFRSPEWPAGASIPVPTTFGVGYAAADLLRLPWTLTYDSRPFFEALPGPAIGLSLLVIPVLIARRSRSRAAAALVVLTVIFGLFWIYGGRQYLRFAAPIFPVTALLAGAAVAGLGRAGFEDPEWLAILRRLAAPVFLLLSAAASLPMVLPLCPSIPSAFAVVTGQQSPRSYRAELLPSYNAYRTIARLHRGERVHILAISDELRFHAPGIVEPLWSPVLPPLHSEAQALAALRKHGVTHLVIRWTGMPEHFRTFFLLQPGFLERYGEREYEGRGSEVYALKYPDGTGTPGSR